MPFRYCLNTSTLKGAKLTLPQEIDLAAEAGYAAIEPWIREIDDYVKTGGSLKDLRKHISDAGLSVESAIGFFEFVVEDASVRQKGMEEAKRNFDLMAQIGGKRIAAPAFGAHEHDASAKPLALDAMAERYAELLTLAKPFGVTPMLELWGFSRTLSKLGEVAHVAAAAGHPDACLLLDVYHLYKGGSSIEGLRVLNGSRIPVFHLNDYPAIDRSAIADKDRVYPGDGIAPIPQIVRILHSIGFNGILSIELFNESYWQQDPLTVARTAIDKARAIIK